MLFGEMLFNSVLGGFRVGSPASVAPAEVVDPFFFLETATPTPIAMIKTTTKTPTQIPASSQ